MQSLLGLGILVLAYVIGSIPSGLIIVHLMSGKDVRQVESGRTGGTNAMRAAGFWAGFLTFILDMLKGTLTVILARWVAPVNYWLHILAPIAAILGHNYSVFLVERGEKGRIRLRGGAGGATCVGGSFGLWFPVLFIIVPVGAIIFYFVGYASITTLSAAFISFLVFAVRAGMGASPWEYALYGLISGGLLAWALRPNLRRLVAGSERMVGYRARKRKKEAQSSSSTSSS